MADDSQSTPTPYGYWDCDCGRECVVKRELPGCRAEWVPLAEPPRAWTAEEMAHMRAIALEGDLRSAADLLRRDGCTVTPPEAPAPETASTKREASRIVSVMYALRDPGDRLRGINIFDTLDEAREAALRVPDMKVVKLLIEEVADA